ncbi:MAG: glycosyltransferase family 2 protein [Parcubacteria group bacterium]|jgi:glycosyltransferase involved in cell wall biosynthesis
MKLVVNMPVFNEEEKLGETIERIKKSFNLPFYSQDGSKITEKLIQIVDDGSSDRSVEIAKAHGVNLIVSYKPNRRLAYAFKQAVENSLANGADIMVNIDADGQFNPNDIPKLLLPILNKQTDISVASRFGEKKAKDIPWIKNFGNRLASNIIGFFLGCKTDDLTCGFRVYSREAMLRLNLVNTHFTYTAETIIDAIGKNLKPIWVPLTVTYYHDRKSKMAKSIYKFVSNSFKVILKAIRDVRPMKFFGWPGLFMISIGLVFFLIFLINYFISFKITPYINYILFSAILIFLGIQLLIFALIADMIKSNRQLTEEQFYQWKKDKYDKK